MILWRTGEKRLCKWDEDGDYSWSVVLTRLLWLKYRQNVIDPQSCIVEQALASPLQCTLGNNWKSMQTEPPGKHLLWKFTLTSVGLFFPPYSDPWAGTASNPTCLIQAACTVHYVGLLVLCAGAFLIEGTQLCVAVLIPKRWCTEWRISFGCIVLFLYARSNQAFVCVRTSFQCSWTQFTHQIEELGLWI